MTRLLAQGTLGAILLLALMAPSPASTASVDTYPRQPGVDALNYAFRIEVTDTSDAIAAELTLDVRFVAAGVEALRLDLANVTAEREGKGMRVSEVTVDGAPVRHRHADDMLHIPLAKASTAMQRARIVVRYGGTAATGLGIVNNRYGDRTFFSDNWPTRARHWLPTIDHPADKATSEFIVTAPSHYQVVSNGLPVEITDLPGSRRRTHWRNDVPIAPWLFMMGVARFAVQRVDTYDGKPIETWVFPQDRDAGFDDFAEPTKQALAFYSDYVGPFAYERLANIQSTIRGGGMETASAILYAEGSVTGTRSERWRNVVIHEVAHQWFGNAVTESDWDDVWLSEGITTYFTLMFIEHAYGRDEFLRGLEASQATIRRLVPTLPGYTIIHRNLSRMEDVTTGLTYQKGGWVMHMLRGVIGDAAFQRGIRAYYREHFNATASTADLRRAMEEASGQQLGWFFEQWLSRPGELKVAGRWSYDAGAKRLRVTLEQVQEDGSTFAMPIEIAVRTAGQALPTLHRLRLDRRAQEFTLDVPAAPEVVQLDPNRWVLMDATMEPGRIPPR